MILVFGTRRLAAGRLLGILHVIIGLTVDGRRGYVGIDTYFFHDVDLAAGGPAFRLVVGHHPEGGPGSLSFGKPDRRFKIAVEPGLPAVHPRGDHLSAILARHDVQGAVLRIRGAAVIGYIALEFVIHTARCPVFIAPFGNQLGRCTGEIVLPDKLVSFRHISSAGNGFPFLLGHSKHFLMLAAPEMDLCRTFLVGIALVEGHFQFAFPLANGLGREREPIVDVGIVGFPDGIGRGLQDHLAPRSLAGHLIRCEDEFRDKESLGNLQGSLRLPAGEGKRRRTGSRRIVGLGRNLQHALAGIDLRGRSQRIPRLSIGLHLPGRRSRHLHRRFPALGAHGEPRVGKADGRRCGSRFGSHRLPARDRQKQESAQKEHLVNRHTPEGRCRSP